ncbi:MAG: hypothetical protein AAGA43_04955 [Bacteroidota bacterium]
MTDKFDNLFKSAIEELQEVPQIRFEEEKVWKRIEEKISSPAGSQFYKFLFICDLVVLGLFFLGISLNTVTVEVETPDFLEKIKVYKKGVVVETKHSIEKNSPTMDRTEVKGSNFMVKNPLDTLKVKELVSMPISKVISNTPSVTKPSKSRQFKWAEETKSLNKATIHIYRPRRYVGSALVFRLKANGVPIHKVRNGKHEIVELPSGPTQFLVGKQKLNMQLKPNETYYLRVSYIGFPVGKPNLEWISKEFAEKELSESHITLTD